jgi:hypothetical protein
MFKTSLYLFVFCLFCLACQTAQAQKKENYVGITWNFVKSETSNAQDTKLVESAKIVEKFFKGSTVIFKANNAFFWNQPAIADSRSGLYRNDETDTSFMLLTNYTRDKTWRYKLAMRNENKELLLTEYLEGDKKITYVFTR